MSENQKSSFTDTESDSLASVGYLLDRLPEGETDADWTSLQNGTIRHLYEMAKRTQSPQAGRVDDLLAALAEQDGWELSKGYKNPSDEEGEYGWCVHAVTGSPNDREWTLIGFGETPSQALTAALHKEG